MPLLTVLMPVYNADKFLDESINSILSQTYSDFEMLILDDASTDNSLKIIKAYAKEDKRIKFLVNQKNWGEAKCRNILLKNSKTEFIAWMDADDISLPYWLQTQMDFLKQNSNIDVVSCHLQFFGDRKSIFKKALLDSQIKSAFLLDCAFGTGGSMIKMKKIRANKIFFNEQLESAEDYDYWIKGCSVLSFAAIDKILYKYRIHSLQDSAINREKQKKTHLLIVEEHLLKFGISMDPKTKAVFFGWEKLDRQTLKKIKKTATQTISIKNFYDYPSIDKKKFFTGFCSALKSLWIKENNISKQQLELASVPLREKLFKNKLSFYDYCRVIYLKIKRRLFYIKIFGILNYIKTRF